MHGATRDVYLGRVAETRAVRAGDFQLRWGIAIVVAATNLYQRTFSLILREFWLDFLMSTGEQTCNRHLSRMTKATRLELRG